MALSVFLPLPVWVAFADPTSDNPTALIASMWASDSPFSLANSKARFVCGRVKSGADSVTVLTASPHSAHHAFGLQPKMKNRGHSAGNGAKWSGRLKVSRSVLVGRKPPVATFLTDPGALPSGSVKVLVELLSRLSSGEPLN